MRKTYKERGQALSKCRLPPLPPICIRTSSENLSPAQFVANFQGDQICDNQQTAVIFSKIKIQQRSLTSFLVLARDYLVQKSWLLNISQIIVLAIRMIGRPACGQIDNVDTWSPNTPSRFRHAKQKGIIMFLSNNFKDRETKQTGWGGAIISLEFHFSRMR